MKMVHFDIAEKNIPKEVSLLNSEILDIRQLLIKVDELSSIV